MNAALVQLGVLQRPLHRRQRRPEHVGAQLLEARARYARVEVLAVGERVDFDGGLGGGGEGAFGALARSAQATQRPLVGAEVLAVLALELLGEVVDEADVKVFAAQVSVARR